MKRILFVSAKKCRKANGRKRGITTALISAMLAIVLLMSIALSGAFAYAADEPAWLEEEFLSPDASYKMIRLLYSFDENYADLIDLAYNDYGYGGIVTNVEMNEDYLKDKDQFKLLDDAYSLCAQTGLEQLWIYDEYQFPSGSAYGQVTADAPEYEAMGLGMIKTSGEGAQNYQLPSEYREIRHAVITVNGKQTPVSFDKKSVSINVSGKWELSVWATAGAWFERDNFNTWQKGRPYINIMNRDAVAKFIRLTHQAYKENMPDSFDKVEAFFTDEPTLVTSEMTHPIYTAGLLDSPLVPWDDSLPEVFKEMHGWDIYERIESLYSGDTVEDKIVRVQYYQTVGRMVADNYFGQINEWCEANGAKGSGHLLLEEKLAYHIAHYGDLMQCMNAMGYPGCDMLWVSPEKLMVSSAILGSYAGIKFASSSARNFGKEHVLAEFNPAAVVYEDPYFVKDPTGTSLAGSTIARMYGADKFVVINPQGSYSPYQSRLLNNHVGRLNTLLEGARMNTGIGVYYPIASLQANMKAGSLYNDELGMPSEEYNELCLDLLKAGYDYNYIDDEALFAGTIDKGTLSCADTSYRVIIMAKTSAIDPDILQKLADFQKSGGVVLWLDSLPEYATKFDAGKSFQKNLKKFKHRIINTKGMADFDELMDALASIVNFGYNVQSDGKLIWSPYIRDGKQIIVAVNTTSEDAEISVSFGSRGYDLYNTVTGKVRHITSSTVKAAGYETLIFVSDNVRDTTANSHYLLRTAGIKTHRFFMDVCEFLKNILLRILWLFA